MYVVTRLDLLHPRSVLEAISALLGGGSSSKKLDLTSPNNSDLMGSLDEG